MGRLQPKQRTAKEAEPGIKKVNMIDMKQKSAQGRAMGDGASVQFSNCISTLKEKLRLWKDGEKSLGKPCYNLFEVDTGLKAPPSKVYNELFPKRPRKGRLIERTVTEGTDSTSTTLLHNKRSLDEEFEKAHSAWGLHRKQRRIESAMPPDTRPLHNKQALEDAHARSRKEHCTKVSSCDVTRVSKPLGRKRSRSSQLSDDMEEQPTSGKRPCIQDDSDASVTDVVPKATLKPPLMAAKHKLVKAAKHIVKPTKTPNPSPVLPPSVTSKAPDGGISNSPAQPSQGEPMAFQLKQLKDFLTLMYHKTKADAFRRKKVQQLSNCRSSDVAALVALFDSTLSLKSTMGQQHQRCKSESKDPNPTILPQAQSRSAHTVTPPTSTTILPEPVKPEPVKPESVKPEPVPKFKAAYSANTDVSLSPQTAETRDVKTTTTARSADELSPSQPNEQSVKQPPQFSTCVKALTTQLAALSLGTKVKPTCSCGKIKNPFERVKKAYYLQKFLYSSHCISITLGENEDGLTGYNNFHARTYEHTH